MPQVRKLTSEEVLAFQNKGKGQRKLIEEQYDAFLVEYNIGEYGEALLESEENRLTVRNRLRAAAVRRGLNIEFKRTNGDLVRFHIEGHHNGASATPVTPAAVAEVAAPAKRKGGRPKKLV